MKKLILLTLTCLSFTTTASTNITEWMQTRFAELDTDNSGYLNVNELRGTTRDWMTKAKISEAEQLKRTAKKLTKLDTSQDKKISLEEFAGNLNKNKNKNKK